MADQRDTFYWKVLIVRCQIGDASAFEELVTGCQPRLRGFLVKLVGAAESVDDLTQEVWIDVFRDLPRLSDPGAFLPWLYRIARNRAYRLFRKRGIRVESLDAMNSDVPQDADPAASFSAEDAAAIHAALDRLGPEYREVVLLRFIEDMSYEDIASVVGCQLGTVKSRLHHAKKSLRRIMEHEQ